MNIKFLSAIAGAFLAFPLSAANAADVIGPPETPDNWAGPYLGLFGGFNNWDFEWGDKTNYDCPPLSSGSTSGTKCVSALGGSGAKGWPYTAPATRKFSDSFNAFSGGLFAGYNFQVGQVVFGVEGALSSFAGDERFSDVPSVVTIDVTPLWQADARARIGYDAGLFLPYVSVGYSWLGVNTELYDTFVQKDVETDRTYEGVSAGFGTDIALSEHLFARAEYLHIWLSEERYSYCEGLCKADIALGQNTFRLGLGLKF
jgi:opacity protein-like surface antigen